MMFSEAEGTLRAMLREAGVDPAKPDPHAGYSTRYRIECVHGGGQGPACSTAVQLVHRLLEEQLPAAAPRAR
jgi:hypothetical protein